MKPGHGREALQILHGEGKRTVHHPVDQETMLLGLDLRDVGTTRRPHEVERGWCDHAHRILKRRRHMEDEPEVIGRRPAAVGYAYRVDETRSDAVGDQILVALDHCWGCRCLADRGCRCSQQTADQCGAAFQKFSSTRSFRIHESSPSNELCRKSRGESICPSRVDSQNNWRDRMEFDELLLIQDTRTLTEAAPETVGFP